MLLSVRDLVVRYRSGRSEVRAVDGANLDLPAGSIMGVVGESGCGKTTLARAIMGVMPQSADVPHGTIRFDGRDVTRVRGREQRAHLWRDIAFIPQSAMNSLDPVYRVGDQLVEVLTVRGGHDRRSARRRAAELFEMVGLDAKRTRDFPHEFSGGMRQRAAIALALALEPKLVIADEPVTALDVIVQRQILDTLKDLQERLHLSVLLVTHDISVVAYVCDLVAVMYAGKVAESGAAATVLNAPYHPYTMGLTNAFPDLERAGQQLTPIEGAPPDLRDPPSGCRFAARCPFRVDACEAEPASAEVEPGHQAACWRAQEAETLRERAMEVGTWQRT